MKVANLISTILRIGTWLLLGGMGLISIAPIIWMILASLKPPDEVLAYPPTLFSPHFGTFENYVSVTSGAPLYRLIANSAFVSIIVTALTILMAGLTAYGLAVLEFPARDALFSVILATMMIPFYVTMIPLFVLIRNFGMYNNYLGVILPAIASPVAIYIMRQHFSTIPREICDSARIDGAGEFGIFWRVMLPLAKPAAVVIGLITFSGAWNDFLWPLIVLQSHELFTLPLGLIGFFGAFNGQWGPIMAFSTISVLPILVLFLIFQRQFIQGLTAGAIKA